MMKLCVRCKESKPLELFSKAATCKDGHRNYCKQCQKQAKDVWRLNNKEKHNAKSRRWVNANKDKRRETTAKYRASNLVKCKEASNRWKKENKDKVKLSIALRRKRIRVATPKWADMEKIKQIYMEAIKANKSVDHIIPLHGELVSGLHVENNLCIISISDNSAKGNKYAIQE